MMFAAHTRWPAMWLVFLLSRTASTASAFVTRELPRFGDESSCTSTSSASGVAECDGKRFCLACRSPISDGYVGSRIFIYFRTRHRKATPLLVLAWLTSRHADFASCSCHSYCRCSFCKHSKICDESDQLRTSCTQEFPHSFWRSSRNYEIVFPTSLSCNTRGSQESQQSIQSQNPFSLPTSFLKHALQSTYLDDLVVVTPPSRAQLSLERNLSSWEAVANGDPQTVRIIIRDKIQPSDARKAWPHHVRSRYDSWCKARDVLSMRWSAV